MMVKTVACLLALVLSTNGLSAQSENPQPDSADQNEHLHRNLLLGNIAILSGAYLYAVKTWGAPDGSFHFKDDFDDNLALSDEVSHAFVGYKLAEGFRWLFGVFKMQQDKIEKYSLLEAGLVTTLVEFPMDAFNPDQGFGVSDLVFNWAGIGFSYLRQRGLENFDMKVSVKRSPLEFENKLLASKNEEFSNFVWWACWKPKYVWLGAGYSINHDQGLVESEYYLGMGTTVYDLICLIDRDFADKIKALDSYFINLHVEL